MHVFYVKWSQININIDKASIVVLIDTAKTAVCFCSFVSEPNNIAMLTGNQTALIPHQNPTLNVIDLSLLY